MTNQMLPKMITPGSAGAFLKTAAGKAIWALVNLADLADVDLTTTAPTDKQILVFDATSGKWLPKGQPIVLLEKGAAVPAGTPVGTLIARKA